jgi:hypothetical protein
VRSPLECIEGRYEHAIFATYSVNLHFFEQWVLPLLRAAGARNVVVLADEAQLGVALADRSLRSIGRSYHAVSVRLGPGAFHPKLFLLAGESGVRACIASANLTVDGQLRNVESAIVLDSTVPDHRRALVAVGAFLRGVTRERAPAHTADAIMAALDVVDAVPDDRPEGRIRVVHNLEQPLIAQFPDGGDLTAVTPYADAGAAAGAVAQRCSLTVITDGAAFAAPEQFFSGAWTVYARDFGKRRLHGKAYWTTAGPDWLLLGSPNLSRQALMHTAAEANTELAVVISPHEPRLPDPPGTTWERDELAETAPRRHAMETKADRTASEGGSFNAWEDDRAIVVEGVPEGATLEHWHSGAWHLLGIVVGDRVQSPDEVRPYLIRWVSDRGHMKQAIVHRADQLRIQRLRPRTTSRAADVVTTLPLDLAGVQALESVLRDLYLLGSLAAEDEQERALQERLRERQTEATGGLSEWMPARPEDEPRIPDIYRRCWRNEPDALLALIRGALRLEQTIEVPEEEWEIFEESLDLDAEREPEQTTEESPAEEPVAPSVEAAVVRRYRNSLVRLLQRGSEFVEGVRDRALADLAFQSVLGLHERIERSPVEVDGELQTLVEADELLRQKLSLLDAYLREREGHDPRCLATARAHLAKCLASKPSWTPLEWEQLENLAYRTAVEILDADEFAADAAREAGESLLEISDRLRPYAERSRWDGYLVEADEILDNADVRTEPFVWVQGEDWFDELESSPAWRLIGYGAVAGFAQRQPYGVLVRNLHPRSKYLAHLVICDSRKGRLYELFRRSADRQWLVRSYSPVDAGIVDDARTYGSEGLLQAGADRSPLNEVVAGEGVVGALLTAIDSSATAASGSRRTRS